MFTIESLIAILQKQSPKTELRTLAAATTIYGLELTGRTNEGKEFRIVAPSVPKKAVAAKTVGK